MPPDAVRIEQCLAICDQTVSELKALKTNAHKKERDRQFLRQIDYAIRTTNRIAERIRLLQATPAQAAGAINGDKLEQAILLAKALRPVIVKTPHSAWQQDMLRRIDDLIH